VKYEKLKQATNSCKDTLLLKLDYTSGNTLNEILNTGLYRHNQVTHGRILWWTLNNIKSHWKNKLYV